MSNMTVVANKDIEQYGDLYANKGEQLLVLEVLDDGRLWVVRIVDEPFAVERSEVSPVFTEKRHPEDVYAEQEGVGVNEK
ncbi:MAG: hypothetical protein EOM31_14195 [Bacteroidia bacterium]|nr:hypothetical protein [Bacteroidia bacterium]